MVRQEPPLNDPRRGGPANFSSGSPADFPNGSPADQPRRSSAADEAPSQRRNPPAEPEGFDIQEALNLIEEIVLDSPRMPVMGRTMINEDELLDQLDAVRLNLPAAFQQAQQLLQERDQMMAEAEQYAQEVIATAEKRAAAILSETTIVRQAEQQAQQLRLQVDQECTALKTQTLQECEQLHSQALQECDDLRQRTLTECHTIQSDADAYADQVLQRMENQFSEMLGVISNGRQQLYDRQQRANAALNASAPGPRRPVPPAASAPGTQRPIQPLQPPRPPGRQ